MYSLVLISLYLLCFYIWALVQLYIRSRVEDCFPPIPYRSAAAHRKNEWKSLIFDFDTEFLHQNSELSKNGWYHWIRLALLRRNQLSLFTFKPIIEPSSCIQRRRLRWVIFTHFATPPTIPNFYRAQCVPRAKKKKKRAGRENSNVPSIVEKK